MAAQLLIIYDPTGKVELPTHKHELGLKSAQMYVADDLDKESASDIAQKLAKILIEQF